MQINQAWANDKTLGVERLDVARSLLRGGVTDGGDLAVENQEIGDGVETIGGINQATACEEKRIHRGERVTTVN